MCAQANYDHMLKQVFVKFQGGILVDFLVKQACYGFDPTDLNGRKRSDWLGLSKLNSLSTSLSELPSEVDCAATAVFDDRDDSLGGTTFWTTHARGPLHKNRTILDIASGRR